MSKYLIEILDEINSDTSNIKKYKDNTALKLLFEYAFNPAHKMTLPDGDPPFKEDSAPLGMSPANLTMEVKKLYVFCRTDLNQVRKETLFIQLLENVHPTEAKLLIAVKDQKLSKLYKKITHKLVFDNDLVSVAPVEKERKKREPKVDGTQPSQEEE